VPAVKKQKHLQNRKTGEIIELVEYPPGHIFWMGEKDDYSVAEIKKNRGQWKKSVTHVVRPTGKVTRVRGDKHSKTKRRQ
jgi:hypothetical protein